MKTVPDSVKVLGSSRDLISSMGFGRGLAHGLLNQLLNPTLLVYRLYIIMYKLTGDPSERERERESPRPALGAASLRGGHAWGREREREGESHSRT